MINYYSLSELLQKGHDIEKIIESRDRKNAGMTAPADGLYLNSVKY